MDFVPKLGRVVRDEPAALPPRPVQPAVPPQDLATAQALLARLREEGQKVVGYLDEDRNFGINGYRKFILRVGDDAEKLLADAVAGRELNILRHGDAGRVASALFGHGEYRGAIGMQESIVKNLAEQARIDGASEQAQKAALHKAAVRVAKDAMRLRDSSNEFDALHEQSGQLAFGPPCPVKYVSREIRRIAKEVGTTTEPEELL